MAPEHAWDTGECLNLPKKFLNRTTPQGSILSPLLWRIFDGTFSQLYKNNFPDLLSQLGDLISINHFSYADDHVTVVTIEVKATLSDAEVGKSSRSAVSMG